MNRLPKPIRIRGDAARGQQQPTTLLEHGEGKAIVMPSGHKWAIKRGELVTFITVKTHSGKEVYAIPSKMQKAVAAQIVGEEYAKKIGLIDPKRARAAKDSDPAPDAFDYEAEMQRLDEEADDED